MKAVFDTKPTSVYDDEVSKHYHFPQRYLSLVEYCVNDWVVLRRPRADGGDLAYFAAAKIISIDPDLLSDGLHYAHFSDFLAFDKPVPWRPDGRYMEEVLRNLPSREVGIYMRGRSVRSLTEKDFEQLMRRGVHRDFAQS